MGPDRDQVALVAENPAYALRQAGFLVSDKSQVDPQRNVTWMGKQVDLSRGRIAPLPSTVATAVLA